MLGAELVEGGVRFGVWAPKAERVDVMVDDRAITLERDAHGVHTGFAPGIGGGTRYRFRIDGGNALPDPRSRFQPEGPHGPSEVIDLAAFAWTDQDWPGIAPDRLVIYELHVGAYTSAGTFGALQDQLDELKDLGVTALELMPVAEFPGRWNWGYDGVDWFAPSHRYGRPEDLQSLVNAAHNLGLAVILDVVYNHFGPDGAYWRSFSDDYFTHRHITAWGDAINFDGPNARFVRDVALDNARQWIRDYHVDGLRLDATDAILDDGSPHILQEIQTAARAATERQIVVIAEDHRNDVRIIRPVDQGGYGLDAVWADDFHHDLRVYLTNARENYFQHFEGALEEVARTVNQGFNYQGQASPSTGIHRGTIVTGEPASAFVFCLQNHDQIGNRPFGDRIHHEIDRGRFMAAAALLLLSPETPLLFMGQEFAASTPFLFFTDHDGELGHAITEGRRREFRGFRLFKDERHRALVPDPQAPSSFFDSKLKLAEREQNAGVYAWHRELLRLRREDPVFSVNDRATVRTEAAGANAIVMQRWTGTERRMLVANFGAALEIPLPGDVGTSWREMLSSIDSRFGGNNAPAVLERGVISIPARAAILLASSN